MKRFFAFIMVLAVVVLAGCDRDDGYVDLSKKAAENGVDESLYGEVLHTPSVAKFVWGKKFKFTKDVYGYGLAFGIDKQKSVAVITVVCDIRERAAGISYYIKNDANVVPKGDVEISLMDFRSGIKDIREADDNRDPIFSTAEGDDDIQAALHKAADLPTDTNLAFVIDGRNIDGSYMGVAWSPLFTSGQLKETLKQIPIECKGLKLDLNNTYLAAAEMPNR